MIKHNAYIWSFAVKISFSFRKGICTNGCAELCRCTL